MTITHRMTKTPTYNSWRSMLERCRNPNNSHWHAYGGRGIQVCERWLTFENFWEDMGTRPAGKTIDRIDHAGHYEPDNCRWATAPEQSRNTQRSVLIEWRGEKAVLKDWALRLGITDRALAIRIKRWGLERAMTPGRLRNGVQVLTDEQALEIRRAKAAAGRRKWGASALAAKFGVSPSAVQQAARGASFQHLPLVPEIEYAE